MIIVVTGNRKGIGRYISEYYLEKGHTVIGCSRDKSDLVNEKYRHFQADVSDEKEMKEFINYIRKDFKYIDVLINNAGIASMNHFLLTPTQTAKKLMEVNYIGTLVAIREFSKLLRKSKNPRIVNFTTVAKPLELEGEAAYAASKAAVETLTRILAKELSQYKITINAIGPTPIPTDLVRNVPEDKMEKLIERQSVKRYGKFQDVSNVLDFFIKPESDFITGQIIYLGGV